MDLVLEWVLAWGLVLEWELALVHQDNGVRTSRYKPGAQPRRLSDTDSHTRCTIHLDNLKGLVWAQAWAVVLVLVWVHPGSADHMNQRRPCE